MIDGFDVTLFLFKYLSVDEDFSLFDEFESFKFSLIAIFDCSC